jgi:hypothetical protein
MKAQAHRVKKMIERAKYDSYPTILYPVDYLIIRIYHKILSFPISKTKFS